MPVAEAYFLKNALADAVLLVLAAKWQGARARPARIALAACFGALCALVCAALGGFFATIWAKALVSLGVICIGIGLNASALMALWLGALLFGGGYRLGLPLAGCCLLACAVSLPLRWRKAAPPPPNASLTVRSSGTTVKLEAIIDSGCRAVDPGTLHPIIVLPAKSLPPPPHGRTVYIQTAAGRTRLCCFTPDLVLLNGTPVCASVASAPEGTLRCALVPWSLCAERRSG